jgi:hypothetical protein
MANLFVSIYPVPKTSNPLSEGVMGNYFKDKYYIVNIPQLGIYFSGARSTTLLNYDLFLFIGNNF